MAIAMSPAVVSGPFAVVSELVALREGRLPEQDQKRHDHDSCNSPVDQQSLRAPKRHGETTAWTGRSSREFLSGGPALSFGNRDQRVTGSV
jgi:hypothetical protein